MQIFNKKRGQKGFTLIELLVVIAIIGILAGIVLVALGGARTRAKDARIQAGMTQARALGELILSSDADYDCVCLGAAPAGCTACHADVATLSTDVDLQNGAGGPIVITRYGAGVGGGATDYCAIATMNTGTYCVDSRLTSRSAAAAAVCPAAAPATGPICP